jgi:transposase
VTVVAELVELARFVGAPQLVAYLGLVPSEDSSGKRERRGGITKTSNSHVRRVLIEAAWTSRHAARTTAIPQRRAKRKPPEVQKIAWSAQKRLCQSFRNLMARRKLKNQVCTATARELVGFIWVIGQDVAPQAGLSRHMRLVDTQQDISAKTTQRWENPGGDTRRQLETAQPSKLE